MRRPLLLSLSVLLVLTAAPASADEASEPEEPELVECENPDGLEVITRDGLGSDIDTPSVLMGNEWEYKDFLLDLSPATEGLQGSLTTVMEWTVRANDYDLEVYSSAGSGSSIDFQPIDPPVETVTIQARHCDVVEVAAYEFIAPVFVDSLELAFSVTAPAVVVAGSQ